RSRILCYCPLLRGGVEPKIPKSNFRRLPFDHCSLSLQPFEYPMCTPEGIFYDIPWLVYSGRLFTDGNVKLKSVILTGNVFSHEAVEQLNVKTKSYRDLLSDEPFTRQDIITLQDPTNLDKFNVSDFFHVKNNLKVLDPDEEKAKLDPGYHLNSTNMETRETLAELYKDYKGDALLASTMKEPQAKKTDKLNAAHYSTGRVSASFTSTAMTPATEHTADAISDDTVRYSYVKKKGYVRLHTNKGDINLELYCDKVPKAGENFTKLCKKGYYDGTVFHRSIRNFMIQGGDPTGTGLGGESFWGKPFKDEFRPNLSHTGRGVLSMANSGPNTNKSQFFITFRSCPYLDRKHTIAAERQKELEKQEEDRAQTSLSQRKTKADQAPKTFKAGIGKYINPVTSTTTKRPAVEDSGPSTSGAKKAKGKTGFGDFSSW
uniref:PPIase cyclophilin-type domain-containing protein n=1 Tax=Oncorhynchus mykiss TaxID=8022 RepID=A0A8K9X5U1_ONCMY